jgi:succinate dehydrogenase / fumarate reductase, cytochrome b subunit
MPQPPSRKEKAMPEIAKKRPEFRNINFFSDLPTYRMAPAAIVSILHRVSGVLIFILLPFILWLFDTSVSSEVSFARFRAAFNVGIGFVPGVLIKLVALALIWAYLHHLCAGLRFLWLDASHHSVNREFGCYRSARVVLAVSLVLTAILGAKLFGLY